MRKEVETTEEAYFCDICGEEITDAHWAYGGHASAAEETKECFVCHRDMCRDCYKYVLTFKERMDTFPESFPICKPCFSVNQEKLEQIDGIKHRYGIERIELEKRFLKEEKALGKFISYTGWAING